MPPATPATKVSLRELADLAIGTPEVGAVNFTALHTLIVAMLKNLNLQETVIDFHTLSPKGGRSVEALQAPSRSTLSSAPQLHHSKDQHKTASRSSSHALGSQVEELGSQVKELGSQVEGLTKQLKTVDSQMQVIAAQVQQITSTSTELGFEAPTVLEVKNMSMPDTEEAQIRSTEVQEDVRKPMNLLHDVVEDVKILKEAYQKAQELKPQEVFQRIEKLEKLIKERDDFLEYMGQKLTLVPSGEEVTMVTWEELEEAIANGWKASQVGSETALGLSKRKVQSSLTSSDLIQSGVSTKYTSTDHIPDSAGGPRQPLPGSSATGHLYEAVTIKQRGKGSFAPGREQHTRAHAEANASRFYQPSIPQFRTESDHHRSREQFTSGYPRRDIHTGPAQQDLPLARDQPIGQGQVYVRPDHHELGLPGIDQLGLPYASTTLPGVVPISVSQLGMLPPQMDCQGLEPLGMDQRGVVPPLVPGRDQQRSGLPGTDQLGVVPLSPYQYGMIIPGTDQCSMKQPGMPESGMRPLGIDQHGFVTLGVNQGGLVPPGGVQQGLEPSGIDQHGLSPVPIDRHGLVSPGLIQVNADQQGFVQPSLETSGFIQPGTEQHDLIWPDRNQSTLGQPGTYRPGLAQPGAEQHGLVQPGEHPPDLVQPGKDQDSLIQPGLDQRRLIQPGTVQHGLTQPGVAQLDVAQHGADQHGLVHPEMGRHDLMQPGTFPSGWVQPGAYPPAWAQAGADSHRPVQPGIGQHGFVQPRMDQSDVVQLGADQQGSVQPGADQQGSVQPGADQQGSVLLVPPGMDQRGLVQPGMDQHGWRQPSADHQSLIVPGTELCRFPPFQADLRSLRSPHPYPYPRGMVPPGQEQHGRLSPFLASQASSSPRTDKESIRPDQQYLVSPGPDQQAQIYPGAVQPGQEHPVWDQQGPGYSGYGGPGSLGVDPRGRVALDPNRIPDFPAQTESDQDATSDRSQDSLSFLHQVSSERSEPRSGTQSEQRNSLEKLAPNFPMALETFRLMGELIGLYVELKENLKDLDEEKAGQTDREKIQYLFTLMVKKILLPDLQEQMKTLKALPKEVHQEKAKVEKVQRLLEGDGEQVAGEELKAGQLALQLGLLRITVTDIEKELADLRDSQEQGKAAMENSVAEASLYLQDQLDKLRTIMESMLASSSTLLSLSITPHKPLTILAPSQIHPEATCPACSLDLSHQVSTLVQRYEQLQEMVSNLAASRPSRKAKLQSQDEELLGHVQSAILQVQGDCEKLNITTSNLIEDHWQKQKDIDVLYQRLEKLEKEKANRKHLQMEIEVKADKSALASKVSRVQLDATTEQLNHMMQELMAKMSGQEQDWQKLLDKLLAEMDMKLDRLELDPVKQALEDRWKSLREQLKERSPLYQADEAAAMRRQLLAHFHCLSCDRPLETPVTGRIIPVTPVGHALPGHRSIRPYTVFELEQVRQQSRNLKLGSTFLPRGDQSAMEQSVGRLRTMHSKMLWDIEKVQIHFGGSVKTSSQMIRQLLQAHCLSSPCYKRGPNSADHTCSTMARRCGGSHTVTYPYRRNRLQHPSQALYAPEEIRIAMKHAEVDLLGLDGHIYKGRMDTRLPGILTKDSEYSHSPEALQSPLVGSQGHLLLHRSCPSLFPAPKCSHVSRGPQVSVFRDRMAVQPQLITWHVAAPSFLASLHPQATAATFPGLHSQHHPRQPLPPLLQSSAKRRT
ncbi:glutamine-rich protein 2 isoform X3 [Heterocephalus glaber]|uniref:Glutamine-rich protein 2 isoform X2 n=1 Tax=Heterocephalus glaber TaxID=10181 RepID=A0AAX6RK04_HETGA|nr:glutamine-rich protein 2 isoform X2 [Heterocephalus glaber]XP_021096668.1 glutamine-rich protein 2 isoform X3 [Heterocephalus glaber]